MSTVSHSAIANLSPARAELSIAPLTWAFHLANDAQQHANQLASADRGLQHSQILHHQGQGENLASLSGYWPDPYTEASRLWYAEKKDWLGGVVGSHSGPETGHYTQVRRASCDDDMQLLTGEIFCADDLEHHNSHWHGSRDRRVGNHVHRSPLLACGKLYQPITPTKIYIRRTSSSHRRHRPNADIARDSCAAIFPPCQISKRGTTSASTCTISARPVETSRHAPSVWSTL